MPSSASAPGKIILSGEYAVLFGHAGLAVPSTLGMEVSYTPDDSETFTFHWEGRSGSANWEAYALEIAHLCIAHGGPPSGTITIRNSLPLGKGMGASTALVVSMSRCLVGQNCETVARSIEDEVNPGHSGLDFATIWRNTPTLFRKNSPSQDAPFDIESVATAMLIDTGMPEQTTAKLVAWIQEREEEVRPHLDMIGACTERLLAGQSLRAVLLDHHRAQAALGVVTPNAMKLIAAIEACGGAAKVLGAGARSGGCGMVLAIGIDPGTVQKIAHAQGFSFGEVHA